MFSQELLVGVYDLLNLQSRHGAGTPAPWSILRQPVVALLQIAVAPMGSGGTINPQPSADLLVLQPIGRQEDDARTLSQPHADAASFNVVSVDPVLIAVFTDLSKSPEMAFPAIKIIRGRMERIGLPQPRVGDRLATVSMYRGDLHDSNPSWNSFDPRPVCSATSDQAAIDRVMASIPDEEWEQLMHALKQVPRPFETKLYRIKTGSGAGNGR